MNHSEAGGFILEGVSHSPELQIPLLIVFTIIYILTALGNLGMILLIVFSSHLHTPMYFFLSNLSMVDFGYSSTTTPKVIAGFLIKENVISYHACASQMFFFLVFGSMENIILALMAYDRYAAVCKPLHYTTTMTESVCVYLVLGSYIYALVNSSVLIVNTFTLSFCGPNVVHHFFCDIPAVMVLSCSDKHVNEMVMIFISSFNVFCALCVVLISYLFIFVSIFKMHSSKGYQRALSTCTSHLTAVSIFYGTVIFMYLQPSASHSMDTDKIASIFYAMVIPMLNPVVYSLRNKEVKSALRKVLEKIKSSQGFNTFGCTTS
ncbi:olfactory receptor 5B2-like [Thomomys bottae]